MSRVVELLNLKSVIKCYLNKSWLDEPCRWDFEAKISNKMQFEQYELNDQ